MAQFSVFGPWAGERNPLDDLRREMDALFGRYDAGPWGARRGVFPAVNFYETEDAYVLTAELPGVSPEDIDVSMDGTTLTLRGKRDIEVPPEASAHRRERQSGAFRRAFELPAEVEADKVEAVHTHGVLRLRLPKAPEHQPRRIAVRSA